MRKMSLVSKYVAMKQKYKKYRQKYLILCEKIKNGNGEMDVKAGEVDLEDDTEEAMDVDVEIESKADEYGGGGGGAIKSDDITSTTTTTTRCSKEQGETEDVVVCVLFDCLF